jgi:hypothetical protein
MMRFAKRAVVTTVRPIYRAFFEEPLWWFLDKVKTFFLAELNVQMSQSLSKAEDLERRLRAIEERFDKVERGNEAQWDSLEQLLLALFRQPEAPASDSEWKASPPQNTAISNVIELTRANEANNLR